ncbi:MEKHLA domain-containing protein [Streptomyces sp. NPDC059629]|uniref:MEKHLA domain-containing protein n=1 Tax=Streptomyces sp. NPDC059629 TaxID=3346889 RepID=UPI0036C06C7B
MMKTDAISVSSPIDPAFFTLLTGSYERLLGRPLAPETPNGMDAAAWLYHEAPFAVLGQNAGHDPNFVYANTTAQRCFAYSWEEFTNLPSRLSAPVADRAARDRLMAGVLRDGYVEGYRGLRESGTGHRFWIEDVTIWNLADADGTLRGQAALIRSWSDA